MQPVLPPLGFEATGANMEKMMVWITLAPLKRSYHSTFFDQLGYEIDLLQVNLETNRNAGSYFYCREMLKPLGYTPDAKPAVPDIVYMVLDKKQDK